MRLFSARALLIAMVSLEAVAATTTTGTFVKTTAGAPVTQDVFHGLGETP